MVPLELNTQGDEFQNLFENVPCLITVQDRDYRLLRYNREFAERFDPTPGDYCFHAYKGRDRKCDNCTVEKTLQDGKPHRGEETGLNKDGTTSFWLFRTSPIRDATGTIVAVMEMSIDVTHRKHLEERLEETEKKYREIFENIPNPVFVLDADTLDILECNGSVETVYGYTKEQMSRTSFLSLFHGEEKGPHALSLRTSSVINREKHRDAAGKVLYVNIRISPTDYLGREALLVTTSDITRQLETEQQLIQAGKLATLGEMASGVAHELNQPLSVIKTASTFFMKKIRQKESIDESILSSLLGKIDSNVDRATKIINHMRQFSRKADMDMERVQVNDVLKSAFEIFSQQLRLRGIETVWKLEEGLSRTKADPVRLEQVFINLLLNARDAIEEKWGSRESEANEKRILISSRSGEKEVIVRICDTGPGIPEAISGRVFEPFFTTKEVGKGTGLGLSISYGIIKEFGGDIRTESFKEGGICFVVTLPRLDEEYGKNDSTG
jgi:histidine kinase